MTDSEQHIEVRRDPTLSSFYCDPVRFHLHHITGVFARGQWYGVDESLEFDAFNSRCMSIISRQDRFGLLHVSLIHLAMFSRAFTSKAHDACRDYMMEVYMIITRHSDANAMTPQRLGAKMRAAFHIVNDAVLCREYLRNKSISITNLYDVNKAVLSDDVLLHRLLEGAVNHFRVNRKPIARSALIDLAKSLDPSQPETAPGPLISRWDEQQRRYFIKVPGSQRRVWKTEKQILHLTGGEEALRLFRPIPRGQEAGSSGGDEHIQEDNETWQAEVEVLAQHMLEEGGEGAEQDEDDDGDRDDADDTQAEQELVRSQESQQSPPPPQQQQQQQRHGQQEQLQQPPQQPQLQKEKSKDDASSTLHSSIGDDVVSAVIASRQEDDQPGVGADLAMEAVSPAINVSPVSSSLAAQHEDTRSEDTEHDVEMRSGEGIASPAANNVRRVAEHDDESIDAHKRPVASSAEAVKVEDFTTPLRPKRHRSNISYNVTALQQRIDSLGILIRRAKPRSTPQRTTTPQQRKEYNQRRRLRVGVLQQNLAETQQLLVQEQAAKMQLQALMEHQVQLVHLLTPEQVLQLREGRLRLEPVTEAERVWQRVRDESSLASQALLGPFADATRLLDETEVSELLRCNIAEAAMDTTILQCGPWPQLVDLLPPDLLTFRRRAVSVVNTFTGAVETRHWMAVLFELSLADARVSFFDSAASYECANDIVASIESALRSRFPGQSWGVTFTCLDLQSDAYDGGLYAVDVCTRFASGGMDSVKSDVPRESVHKLRRLHSSQLYSSVKPTPDASGDQVWCTPLPAWVSNAFDRVPAARLWDDQQDNRLPEYLTQDYFPADDGSFCPTESERFLPLESHVTVDRVSLERMQAEPMVGATRRPSLPIPRVCSVQEMREMGHLGCRWDELDTYVPSVLSSHNIAITVDTQIDKDQMPHWVPALFCVKDMKVTILDSLQQSSATSERVIARTQQALLGHDSTQPWDVEYRVLPMAVVERDCDVYAMYVCEYFYRHKRPPEASTLPTAEELHMLRRKHLADRYEFDVWTMERGIDYLVRTGRARRMMFYPSVQPVNECDLRLDVPRIQQAFKGESKINASLVLQAPDGHYILVLFRLQLQHCLHALVWDPLLDVDSCSMAIKSMQSQLRVFLPEINFTFRGKLRRALRFRHDSGPWVLEALRCWSDTEMRWYRDEDACPINVIEEAKRRACLKWMYHDLCDLCEWT